MASGGEEPKSLLATYVPAILNFLILVALLVFMMKKMDIKGYFRKRTELIEQTLREAREAKELAMKALAQVEERLKIKDKEMEEILSAARESGKREKARIIVEGARLKDRILEPGVQAGEGEPDHALALRDEVERRATRVQRLVEELGGLGCELKDFEQGLVDFYALLDDRLVFLCWRLGEDRITHWHEVGAGFAGRQPVDSTLFPEIVP